MSDHETTPADGNDQQTETATNDPAGSPPSSDGGSAAPPSVAATKTVRRVSYADSVPKEEAPGASDGPPTVTSRTVSTRSSIARRRSSSGTNQMWNGFLRRRESGTGGDDWDASSNLTDDEYDEVGMTCWQAVRVGAKRSAMWTRVTLKTAVTTPSIGLPCLLLLAVLIAAGLLIVNEFENSETESRKSKAVKIAEQTDLFFVRVLENAFVPLFTMAQFVQELPEFRELDVRIGDRCDPSADPANCTNSDSAPVMPGKEGTHRDLSILFDTPYGRALDARFNHIAAGIKSNSGLGRALVNIQLAPKGVVSMLHPMVNCDDFDGGYCMNNTGAWGHDLLNDPNRVAIARATVPADGVVTAGPLKLIQGEDTFIARIAINMDDETSPDGEVLRHRMVVDGKEYPCWGFAVVLLNWKVLKEESKIYDEFEAERMQFRLTRTDVKDGIEKVVTIAESANSAIIEDGNVTLSLDTGDNGWTIAVAYDDGFAPNYKVWAYPLIIVGSIAFTLLLMLILVSKAEHERLLLNLMPRRAISKLRKGEVVVDRFSMVTIFFSDIVGYTKMSAEMTPIEVMQMLNSLYSRIDELAKKHGVMKIETIGDAYIAVAGVRTKCTGPEAAERMTLFALDAMDAVRKFETEDGSSIAIRAGLASGPVVAGVVGSSLPKYTLFGDTVSSDGPAPRVPGLRVYSVSSHPNAPVSTLRPLSSTLSLREKGQLRSPDGADVEVDDDTGLPHDAADAPRRPHARLQPRGQEGRHRRAGRRGQGQGEAVHELGPLGESGEESPVGIGDGAAGGGGPGGGAGTAVTRSPCPPPPQKVVWGEGRCWKMYCLSRPYEASLHQLNRLGNSDRRGRGCGIRCTLRGW